MAEKKIALLSMAALVLLILIPNCFPADSPVVALSNKFGLSGKLLLIFAVTQLIRIEGKPASHFIRVAKNGINWNLMMLVANIMAFSSLIGSEAVGISAFLGDVLAPIFLGKPTLLFIILAAVTTVICTNFMVNKIIAVLIMMTVSQLAWNLLYFSVL